MACGALLGLDSAENAPGQHEERGDELKYAVHDYPNQPEGQQHEPDERIQDQGQQRRRPAHDKQDAKEKQLDHDVRNPFLSGYAANARKVPRRWTAV